MADPLVTVTMTTYNHEKYIIQAIQSVLDQTFQDFELVIVNDGSSDGTGELIEQFSDARIQYFFQENQGPSVCANTALKNARGRYIALMSGDDLSTPDRLEKQFNAYINGKRRLLFSGCTFIDDAGKPLDSCYAENLFSFTNKPSNEILNYFFYNGNYFNGITCFTEKAVFDDIGIYDLRLLQLQDFSMWMNALFKGYDIEIIPDQLVQYRIRSNDGNLSSPRKDAVTRSNLELKKILRRYFEIDNEEQFKSIFPEVSRLTDEFTVRDIPYLLLRLAYGSTNTVLKEFVIETFYEQFDREYYDYLNRVCGFRMKDFYSFTGYYGNSFSQLYIDTGDGFNENEKIIAEREINNPLINVTFNLTGYKNIKALRFDPVEDEFCRIKIKSITADSDAVNIRWVNSVFSENGWDTFLTCDPSYYLDGNFSTLSSINIQGEIKAVQNDDIAKTGFDLLNELNSIKGEISYIKNTRVWRFRTKTASLIKSIAPLNSLRRKIMNTIIS